MSENKYTPESVGSIMSTNVLTAQHSESLLDVINRATSKSWDDVQYVFVLDGKKLVGMFDFAQSLGTDKQTPLSSIVEDPIATLHLETDREAAVRLVIKDSIASVPIVDKQGNFLGAVTDRAIIDTMHDEHIEDILLGSGVTAGGVAHLKALASGSREMIRSRSPWLISGTIAAMGIGLLSSFFEGTLQEHVALAFFIPVIAYVANSVGAQTQAIIIRALALAKIEYGKFLAKETMVGAWLGVIVGTISGFGAFIISGSIEIGYVVGLSLFVGSAFATLLAGAIPILLKKLGKDPALGSGPLATVAQDIVSILIYLVFAIMILN